MSTREKLIKARLGMLALAEELQNIKLACKRAGISRSHYYEIKEAFEKFGPDGLVPASRRKPRMPNQTPPELERRILEMTEQYPTYSYLRISGQLRLIGVGVSPSAVRAVHRRTQVASPETNGFCERFHRTVQEEFFVVAFRKTFYESLDQLQLDLDRYLEFYNRERSHQGYRTQGRVPLQAFLDGLSNLAQAGAA